MADLFSPLAIAGMELPNRLVMAPSPSGLAAADGFIPAQLITHYRARARGGVGLIISEPFQVLPPAGEQPTPYLGLWNDAFIADLRRLSSAIHSYETKLFITLDAPPAAVLADARLLTHSGEQFVFAAWRALAAGADGVMLSAASAGLLHALFSPLSNRRDDQYGGTISGRMRLAQEIVEGIRLWLGKRLPIGFRLAAEELAPGGASLQDARFAARRLAAAGVQLFDVTVIADDSQPLATFPGWSVPLANAIKRVTPEVPVICGGELDEPLLADSLIRDESIDLVMVDRPLRDDPGWPEVARREVLAMSVIE
jgi:NADPH2 dehydrogenase